MKKIILLSGYLKSGKDLVGEYLVEKYNYKRLAFADSLKHEVSSLYKIPLEDTFTQHGKAKKITLLKKCGDYVDESKQTIRQILIDHGMFRRSQDPNYWIHKVKQDINTSNHDKFVITDCRFPNEFNVLNNDTHLKIKVWRINRW